jgi:hypothetical protein
MNRLTNLEARFLEASDIAWNVYHISLKLEQWAACVGLDPNWTSRLRVHLTNKGIL